MLKRLFWTVAFGDVLLILAAGLKIAAGPTSRYDALGYIALLLILGLLGLVVGGVALIRHSAAYAIGLVMVIAPPLYIGGRYVMDLATAPSAKALQTGRGYFTEAADRALAEAIVARDGAKVASLAPAANMNAVGWGNMTFLRLALEDGHADPDVVAALLRAGADPDQDYQLLFGGLVAVDADYGVMTKEKDEPLLRAVIDAGVDLNHRDRLGYPRFFSGLKWPEGLLLMLQHGANTEAEDNEGYTAIMWAVTLQYWSSVDVLLAHGARIDHVARDGKNLRGILSEQRERLQGDMPPQFAALEARLR